MRPLWLDQAEPQSLVLHEPDFTLDGHKSGDVTWAFFLLGVSVTCLGLVGFLSFSITPEWSFENVALTLTGIASFAGIVRALSTFVYLP